MNLITDLNCLLRFMICYFHNLNPIYCNKNNVLKNKLFSLHYNVFYLSTFVFFLECLVNVNRLSHYLQHSAIRDLNQMDRTLQVAGQNSPLTSSFSTHERSSLLFSLHFFSNENKCVIVWLKIVTSAHSVAFDLKIKHYRWNMKVVQSKTLLPINKSRTRKQDFGILSFQMGILIC